jgi:hypothetical protein
MSTKALVVAIIGAACVGAAAAGGFVAVRLNGADHAMATVGAPDVTQPVAMSVPTATPTSAPEPAVIAAEPKTITATTSKTVSSSSTKLAKPAAATTPKTASPTRPTPAAAATHDSVVAPIVRTVAPTPVAAPTGTSTAVMAAPPVDPTVTLQADSAPPTDPPVPQFDEVTVNADSVIGLALDDPVSSDTAKIEDKVTAKVTRDVMVDGRIAIASNSRLEGVVTAVDRGGKFKAQSRIGVRFTTLYLPDNTKIAVQTETVFRVGEAPANEATSKVGASAVVGAILGAVIGGKKGAAIGTAAGAAGGTAAVAAGHGNDAVIPAGAPLTVRLSAPVTVSVRRNQDQ